MSRIVMIARKSQSLARKKGGKTPLKIVFLPPGCQLNKRFHQVRNF